MPDSDGTSETQVPATGVSGTEEQPGRVAAPASSTPPSEGGTAAQEQPKPEAGLAPMPPAISDDERMRREIQSRSDTIVAQKLREIETQRANQAEQARLKGMSDREYRMAMQQKGQAEAVQQALQEQVQTMRQGDFVELANTILSIVPDEKGRESLRVRAAANEFPDLKAFAEAAVELKVAAKETKQRTAIQEAERVAAQKQARAELSGGMPQLGSGQSMPNLSSLTPRQKIRLGLEMAQREHEAK